MTHSPLIIIANVEEDLEFGPRRKKNSSYQNQNQTTTDYDAAATSITTSPSHSHSAGRYLGEL